MVQDGLEGIMLTGNNIDWSWQWWLNDNSQSHPNLLVHQNVYVMQKFKIIIGYNSLQKNI